MKKELFVPFDRNGNLLDYRIEAPIADVAPRAEVERLQEDVERLQEINNRHVENIRLAKQEIAREIFEELIKEANLRFDGFRNTIVFPLEYYCELKKKYTEGQK